MPTSPDEYDYRTSSLDEDRRRAKEVEDRVERNRRRSTASQGDNSDGTAGRDDDAAARAIQGHYRCAASLLVARDQRTSGGRQERRADVGREEASLAPSLELLELCRALPGVLRLMR